KVPYYLNNYFALNNFIIVYPMQLRVGNGSDLALSSPSFLEPLAENFTRLDDLGRSVVKLLHKFDSPPVNHETDNDQDPDPDKK
ncbi:MAG TPA: hypothetical protein PLM07_13080, partial [Candidatus Rifleibacterium sp.]|nr:hypothetical protein [Candidatus Rifleibacterium sp.]